MSDSELVPVTQRLRCDDIYTDSGVLKRPKAKRHLVQERCEAADRIETLEAQVKALREALEELREAANDILCSQRVQLSERAVPLTEVMRREDMRYFHAVQAARAALTQTGDPA